MKTMCIQHKVLMSICDDFLIHLKLSDVAKPDWSMIFTLQVQHFV